MKRLICLFLSFLFIFSFSGCKKDKNESSDGSIDLEYYAKVGQMPETKYALGEDIETVNKELKEIYDTVEESVYNVSEKEDYVKIDSGTFQYYYKKAKQSEGISYIVSFDSGFEFALGTVSIEIKNALKKYEYKEEELNENNSFFVLGSPEGSILKYEFKDNTVAFVIVDDALYATAIYKTNDWE